MNRKVNRTTSILVALLLFFTGNIPVYAFSPISDNVDFAPGVSVLKIGLAANQLPVINVWYETNLKFGDIGNPQRQINILGNVRDNDGAVTSLTYRLNGGSSSPDQDLGPNTTRLIDPGDFNISLNTSDLNDGVNSLVLSATDNNGETQEKTVTFSYKRGRTSPFPYQIDWSKSAVIQNQAQVVDGAWNIDTNAGTIYPTQIGYDRVIAIGDMNWTDYEVTVPITIHAFTGDTSDPGGVGVITRWQGHSGSGQPPIGWNQIGSYGYLSNRSKALTLRLNGNQPTNFGDFAFNYNTTYILKVKGGNNAFGGQIQSQGLGKGENRTLLEQLAIHKCC